MRFIKYFKGKMAFEEILSSGQQCNAGECQYDKKCKTDDKFRCKYEVFDFSDKAIDDIRIAMNAA